MTFNHDLFGPHVNARVTIANGVATQIEVFNPRAKTPIIFPGDWASALTGTDAEIIEEVSRNLNGAKVIKA